MNKRKGFLNKTLWFKHQKEYNDLIDYLESNEKEKLFDLLFEIKKRGDL